ncbi:MAG: S9 family peptidase [Kordiimonadaceae bacterium]|nr:S9 family peptidase [Kordiimonadaceae bacterium]
MPKPNFIVAIVATLTFSTSVIADNTYAKPSQIPAKVFAAVPTFSAAKLSPSGDQVGYFARKDGEQIVIIQSLIDGQLIELPLRPGAQVQTLDWATEDTLILTHRSLKNSLISRNNGIVNHYKLVSEFGTSFDGIGTSSASRGLSPETRLYSYNLKTQQTRWLGKPRPQKIRASSENEIISQYETLIDILPNEPNHVLIGIDLYQRSKTQVYKVGIETGSRRILKMGNEGIQQWFSDQNSEVRFGIGNKVRGNWGRGDKVATLKDASGKWHNLAQAEWYKTYEVAGFTKDANVIYVSGPTETGSTGLFTLNIQTGSIIEEVFAPEAGDVQSMLGTDSLGIAYTDTMQRTKYLDPFYAKLQSNLDSAFPDMNNRIVNKARDAERYLIVSSNDRDPGTYYVYDRATSQSNRLAKVRADIMPELMAPVSAVRINMRDGSSIEAYLTLPLDHTAGDKTPFIVLPHNGPAERSTADWNWWVQFYASRGYGIIQPNFRGSDGYGQAFQRAGYNQWGGTMQDDITDTTRWLISEGLAAQNDICIAGGSFGGYAALMGSIKEPSLYQCAISVNGITNIPSVKKHDRRFWGSKLWTENMGLKGKSDKDVSPYHQAEKLNVPTLLVASKEDHRIPSKQSISMHEKLQHLNKNSTYVSIPTNEHKMVTESARLQMLQTTEKFLTEHIGHTEGR